MSEESISHLTPRAQQVLDLARMEAKRFNHNFIGTEHLLLGLIKLGQGTGINVLQKLGLDLEVVCGDIEKQVGTGPDQKVMGPIPFTPRVRKVLALAEKESKALNHTYVGTEHLLLGLLREGDGVAAKVLRNLDVDFGQTKQEILKEIPPGNAAEPGRRPTPATSATLARILELAQTQALALDHPQVGAEHLLLGLLRESDNMAAQTLQSFGVDFERARAEILRRLALAKPGSASAGGPTTGLDKS